MNKKILAVFVDPGGGLAVTAVAEKINEDKSTDLVTYSGKQSAAIAERTGLKYFDIEPMIDRSEAEEIIQKFTPDLLLTSTGGGNTEQEFRNTAFRENIPSVVILDFWKDYKRRWLYADHEIDNIKDKICVMDVLTKEEVTADGIPEKNITVTGHPYLDKIFNSKEKKNQMKTGGDLNILLLSQPLDIIGVSDYEIHPLKLLSETVSEYSDISGKKINLIIRLHPAEILTEEIKYLLEKKNVSNISFSLSDKDEALDDLISKSGLVFGYNSIALFEARSLNKRVISIDSFRKYDSLTKAFKDAGIESVPPEKRLILDIMLKETTPVSTSGKFRDGINNCLKVISEALHPEMNIINIQK